MNPVLDAQLVVVQLLLFVPLVRVTTPVKSPLWRQPSHD